MTRFWLGVFPLVRSQLRGWQQQAAAIPDPLLREQALATLDSERLSAAGAALFAATTRRRWDPRLVRSLVAYQVLCDYLDTLAEQPSLDPLANGAQLHRALADAVGEGPLADHYRSARRARRRRLRGRARDRLPRGLRDAAVVRAGARGGAARGAAQRGAGSQSRARRRARSGAADVGRRRSAGPRGRRRELARAGGRRQLVARCARADRRGGATRRPTRRRRRARAPRLLPVDRGAQHAARQRRRPRARPAHGRAQLRRRSTRRRRSRWRACGS